MFRLIVEEMLDIKTLACGDESRVAMTCVRARCQNDDFKHLAEEWQSGAAHEGRVPFLRAATVAPVQKSNTDEHLSRQKGITSRSLATPPAGA